ncbi:uncharacterized protein BDZ99DRAFT_149700 [Mytilinidion resinicola]|uniref:Heterokaryon incompatibility domain-containing protein n=1 Tax=Mytilinidion resinicola TaxID=574789 RepID=A0A6A6Y761_9PEZI|nr:uncharacterized protein BDZ99DRAFT_149700 [Mytilinidion resinicola]KAF2804652.1 hypothetical protein BDZ99DRAFT_149700 [Mytilinidion resinicola]
MDATDARDRIFGLLGMASDVEELGIRADYTKPCSDIYTTVAAAFLERQKNIQILSRCRFPKKQLNLPTWVPDWSDFPLSYLWNAYFSLFSAGKCARKQTLRVSGNSLIILGASVDVVGIVGWSWDSAIVKEANDTTITAQKGLGEITTLVSTNCAAYPTAEAREDAVWRTSILDQDIAMLGKADRWSRRATPLMHSGFKAFYGSGLWPNAEQHHAVATFVGAMVAANEDRRYFTTRGGYLGIGPVGIRSGDLVCIILDADVPFVLRKSAANGAGNAQFELVGECYVHGIMDGEFLRSNPEILEFTLV